MKDALAGKLTWFSQRRSTGSRATRKTSQASGRQDEARLARTSLEGWKAEFGKVDREMERLVDTIVGGVRAAKVNDRMIELDARRRSLKSSSPMRRSRLPFSFIPAWVSPTTKKWEGCATRSTSPPAAKRRRSSSAASSIASCCGRRETGARGCSPSIWPDTLREFSNLPRHAKARRGRVCPGSANQVGCGDGPCTLSIGQAANEVGCGRALWISLAGD